MKNYQFALLALAIAAFSIGTTEFISVGLLPLISDYFNVSVALSGLTVSLYAFGVTIGAPVITTMTNKIPRKQLLMYIMLVFIAGNLLAAFSPNFIILLFARIFTAFSHGVFMSIATKIASDIVPPSKRASAIAIMFTGLTVATITGVPIGTFIGQRLGWQLAFIFISVIGFISLLSVLKFVPKDLEQPQLIALSKQLGVLKEKHLLMVYLITALGYGGSFVIYTYITELLSNVMGYSEDAIVIILIIYGVMVAIGNTLGGKFTNTNPVQRLIIIFLVQSAMLFIVGLTTSLHTIGLIAILALGLLFFMNVPGLQLIVMLFAEKYTPQAVNFASSLNISAFNIGIMLGTFIGGYVVESLDITIAPYVGGAIVLIASFLMYVLHKMPQSSAAVQVDC
ncbi:MFS transporter [Macrococcus capreoli]|uniref:MFS transporter n=1 Tax=Macrococcus capreoli TaxID=2982690 RepID=UPI0021D5A3BF|nr:MFS transporter [Macrococcus sp. TMW 2.2395]MCU7558176.1 MFS transporter [Macrococcus sp. TMW 2.2395]